MPMEPEYIDMSEVSSDYEDMAAGQQLPPFV